MSTDDARDVPAGAGAGAEGSAARQAQPPPAEPEATAAPNKAVLPADQADEDGSSAADDDANNKKEEGGDASVTDKSKQAQKDKEDREKLLYLLQVASDSPDEDDDSVQDDDDDDGCEGKKNTTDDDHAEGKMKEVSPSSSSSSPLPRKRKATDAEAEAETEISGTTSTTSTTAAARSNSSSGSVGVAGTTVNANGPASSYHSSAARATATGTAPMPNGGLEGLAATALTNAAVAPISTMATGMATASANTANTTIAPPAPLYPPASATTGSFPVPSSTITASTSGTSPKKRRRKAVPRKPTFAQKLMMILSDPECQEVISWMPDGQSFVIANPNPGIFGPLVMGRYFGNRSAKFESFTRKLNRWGFKRITTRGSGAAVAYCHHLFQRDIPDLCTKMKGDGGLRATDEERQAAAAAGIDPRRAQGLEGMTSAQISQRQAELEKEREMRKAGLVDPPYKKKAGRRSRGVPSVASIPAGMPSTAAGSTATVTGASVGPAPIAAASSMPGAGDIAGVPPGLVSQAANVAARELIGELEHLRRIRDEKGRLQTQAALAAAAYSAASTGGSPFLRPTAAAGAIAAGAGVYPGGMPGMLQPSLPPTHPQPAQSSTSLLEQQLRLQQQLEIEHERMYLERIKQERQLEEHRLRAIQQQQLQQQQLRAASAMSSPLLPARPPGGVHHNPALALAASSGLITHPLGPPASAGTPNDGPNESYSDALNNYYDARTRLIAAKFDAEDGKAATPGSPSNPPDSSAGKGPRKGGTGM